MAVCGVAWVALFTGCTMCPDPLDYSGPVPGGSAPQNDFRARSNGILPLGVAPKPWPPVVKAAGEVPDETVPPEPEAAAEPDAIATDGSDATDLQEPAAVVTTDAEADAVDEPAAEAPEGVEPASAEEPFPDILPPPRPPRPLRLPSLRETLGWKPRG